MADELPLERPSNLELPWWGRWPWFYVIGCAPMCAVATANWFLGHRVWTLFDLAILATILPPIVLFRRACARLYSHPA